MKKYLVLLISLFVFAGCAGGGPQTGGISKVYELDYPEGISVVLYDDMLRRNIEIQGARLVNSKYKKQVQFIINNKSSEDFNLKVSHEWTDSRGIIQNKVSTTNIRLKPKSGKRVVLSAPNFKSQDVLINISCNSVCINEQK